MIKFKSNEFHRCLICGEMNSKTQLMEIETLKGENIVSFGICPECMYIMFKEFENKCFESVNS